MGGEETTKSDWTKEERNSTFGDFRQNRKRESETRIEIKKKMKYYARRRFKSFLVKIWVIFEQKFR